MPHRQGSKSAYTVDRRAKKVILLVPDEARGTAGHRRQATTLMALNRSPTRSPEVLVQEGPGREFGNVVDLACAEREHVFKSVQQVDSMESLAGLFAQSVLEPGLTSVISEARFKK